MVFRGVPFGPHQLRFFSWSHQSFAVAADSVQEVLGNAIDFLVYAFVVVIVVFFSVVDEEQAQCIGQQLTVVKLVCANFGSKTTLAALRVVVIVVSVLFFFVVSKQRRLAGQRG